MTPSDRYWSGGTLCCFDLANESRLRFVDMAMDGGWTTYGIGCGGDEVRREGERSSSASAQEGPSFQLDDQAA